MSPLDDAAGREPEIATGTLAEIYAQQGLYERALEIYRRIRDRRPEDAEIARRIAAIEEAMAREEADEGAAPAPEEAVGAVPEGASGPAGEEPPGPGDAATPRAEPPPEPAEPAGSVDASGGAPPVERDDAFREWLDRR